MTRKLHAFTFITGNPNKARYVAEWLGKDVPHRKIDLHEVQSLDLQQVVEHKAREAYRILRKPVLVEDANLCFNALGRLPGTFIRWFIEELDYQGLCRLLDGFDDRSAHGRICYVLYDGATMHSFEGEMRGRIAKKPRGTGGFGFDSIFINDGYDVTRAQMPPEDYAKTSYRKIALDKLKEFLNRGA